MLLPSLMHLLLYCCFVSCSAVLYSVAIHCISITNWSFIEMAGWIELFFGQPLAHNSELCESCEVIKRHVLTSG